MVRCEEFYKYFEKKGNFCNKSDIVVKKVEEYIAYIKRNNIGTYKISNCALDPFINIEYINGGIVHRHAVRELKNVLKRRKILPEKITRRMGIEIINKVNNKVGESNKLDRIPGIRNRMGDHEHDIGDISYETRNIFNEFKKDIGIKNNNQALKIILECCIRSPEEVKRIKEDIENKEKTGNDLVVVKSA